MGTTQKCNKCKQTYRYSSFDIRTVPNTLTQFEVTCKCGNVIRFGGTK